ncbi:MULTISPECIES: DUF6232 family protein [unclassified Alistipes]|uniref:DUF6232 family protein n=1 Tax=unclassified Alistipes TaxID=2608932 RepID=UPI0011774772|nr:MULTISPECIES: DUF6232 family protein [unclassified Alistipes]
MEQHPRIRRCGHSLTIDEMYFRIDEIRFVDVVKQSRPLLRQLLILCAVCCTVTALLFHDAYPDATLFFAVCAAVEFAVAGAIRRRYALRIGQPFGTSKVLITTDRKQLEELRDRILAMLREQDGPPQRNKER